MSQPSRVFRMREQSVILAVFGVVLLIAGPVQLASSRRPFALWLVAVFALIEVALGCYLLFRLAWCGARATDDGIRIVNPFRTQFARWSDISGFAVRRVGLFPGVGCVDLHEGTTLRIWGIQIPNPLTRPRNRTAQRLIGELNGLLAEHNAD